MRRVVITGIGLVTPIGNDLESTWAALLAGKSGAGPITLFDTTDFATKFALRGQGLGRRSKFFDKRELKHLDRFLQFGVAAGDDGGRGRGPRRRRCRPARRSAGARTSARASAACARSRTRYAASKVKGPRHGFSPYFVTDIIINELPGMVSIRTGATGPNISHVSACSTGAHSIGEAFRTIRHGYADGMIAAAPRRRSRSSASAASTRCARCRRATTSPTHASRPFDKDRDGFVIGEGAGVVVLEELEHAKKRGARIYAELVGYGANGDAYHVAAPAPEAQRRAGVHASSRSRDAKLDPSDDRLHQRARHVDRPQRQERDDRDQGGVRRPREASSRCRRPSR